MIDVMLAGDNAIVIGALAARLQPDQRRKVILIGIGAALVLRIIFALLVTRLLQIVGLILAGGLLLLWVSWKMYRSSIRPVAARGRRRSAGTSIQASRPPRASPGRPGRSRPPMSA